IFGTGYQIAAKRRRANLSARSTRTLAVRSVALSVVLLVVAWYLNKDRGVGWMVVFFGGLVVVMNYAFTRTQWGRSLFAIGGNVEAARRSGIHVSRVYIS